MHVDVFTPNLLWGKMKPTQSRSLTLMFLSLQTRQSQLKNLLDAADTPRRCPGKGEEMWFRAQRCFAVWRSYSFVGETRHVFQGTTSTSNNFNVANGGKNGGTCQKATWTTSRFSLEIDVLRFTRYLQTHQHRFGRVIRKMTFVKFNNSKVQVQMNMASWKIIIFKKSIGIFIHDRCSRTFVA